jgi:hypothetical protein
MTITLGAPAEAGRPRVIPQSDRRSWGILAGRHSAKTPVDRDAGMEIAQTAIPTPAWTARRARRPQRPTRHFFSSMDDTKNERRKMSEQGSSRDALPSSLRSDE